MPTPRPELQHSLQQPTLQLEMFPEEATRTGPSSAPRSPTADVGPSRTRKPSRVWKMLLESDKERIKSIWAKVMREVADERGDR